MRNALSISVVLLLLMMCASSAQENPDPPQVREVAPALPATWTRSDFRALLSQAQSGDAIAQYWVALASTDGRLVPQDFEIAAEWMLKSAEQGYAPAQRSMGMMHLRHVNGVTSDGGGAEIWLRRAAMQGDAEAQFWLGNAYDQGFVGGAADYREALYWLRKAAEQGHSCAQFSLGQMYEVGEGVPENYVLAAKWYRKAAEHVPDFCGASQGRNGLGRFYMDGLGVPRNYVLAYMWFALAGVEANVKDAQSHMTSAQVTEAQRMAQNWTRRHTVQQENVAHPPETAFRITH